MASNGNQLAKLDDFAPFDPDDGDVVTYDAASGKYRPSAPSGGSLPTAYATKNGDQSVANNNDDDVAAWTEVSDPSSLFDPTTGAISLSAGRRYLLVAQLAVNPQGAAAAACVQRAHFYVDGGDDIATSQTFQQLGDNVGPIYVQVQAIRAPAAPETIRLAFANAGSGQIWDVQGEGTTPGGTWLHVVDLGPST